MKYKNRLTGKYRSKLEQYCAEQLTKHKIKYEYEPHKIVLIEGFESEINSYEKVGKKFIQKRNKILPITYTPDFVGDSWIIETKGKKTADFVLKWKLFKYWILRNSKSYDLYMPTNKKEVDYCVSRIREGYSPP